MHLIPILLAIAALLTFYAARRRPEPAAGPPRVAQLEQQQMVSTPVSPTYKGLATIVWGTAPGGTGPLTPGTPVAPVIANQITARISLTPINNGPLALIENGDGARVGKVLMVDGFEGTVEALYDTALTYPALYGSLSLVLPKAMDFGFGTVKANYTCTVESAAVQFERKGIAMITWKISHSSGVEGNPS